LQRRQLRRGDRSATHDDDPTALQLQEGGKECDDDLLCRKNKKPGSLLTSRASVTSCCARCYLFRTSARGPKAGKPQELHTAAATITRAEVP
jgi:hypothetical protein